MKAGGSQARQLVGHASLPVFALEADPSCRYRGNASSNSNQVQPPVAVECRRPLGGDTGIVPIKRSLNRKRAYEDAEWQRRSESERPSRLFQIGAWLALTARVSRNPGRSCRGRFVDGQLLDDISDSTTQLCESAAQRSDSSLVSRNTRSRRTARCCSTSTDEAPSVSDTPSPAAIACAISSAVNLRDARSAMSWNTACANALLATRPTAALPQARR